ncbi:ORF6N domain-containing protein [bacterium]|nr:ORF6N domain-containing protein [bacterium]
MQIKIEDKILVIRGQYVMIDRDLAELYGVESKKRYGHSNKHNT